MRNIVKLFLSNVPSFFSYKGFFFPTKERKIVELRSKSFWENSYLKRKRKFFFSHFLKIRKRKYKFSTYFHAGKEVEKERVEGNIELSGGRWSLQKEISKRINRAGGGSTMECWIQIEMSVDRTWTGVDVERVRRRVNKYGAKKRGSGSYSPWPLSLSSETKMISRGRSSASRLLHSYQPDIKCIVYFNLPRRGSVAFMYNRVHNPREKPCCIASHNRGRKRKKK